MPVAIIVFVINLILAGFCVYYMFFASRYYRRRIRLLDTENGPEEAQSPTSLADTSPRTAVTPLGKSSMSVKEKTRSFFGLVHVRKVENDVSGIESIQTEPHLDLSLTSTTDSSSTNSSTKEISPTKKARVRPYTADPQHTKFPWEDDILLNFEPVRDLKPFSNAQAFAL